MRDGDVTGDWEQSYTRTRVEDMLAVGGRTRGDKEC